MQVTNWRKVVFASDCNANGDCPECGVDYGECPCPGPTQEDLYEYEERNGELWARLLEDTPQYCGVYAFPGTEG